MNRQEFPKFLNEKFQILGFNFYEIAFILLSPALLNDLGVSIKWNPLIIPFCAILVCINRKLNGLGIWSAFLNWNDEEDRIGHVFNPGCVGNSWIKIDNESIVDSNKQSFFVYEVTREDIDQKDFEAGEEHLNQYKDDFNALKDDSILKFWEINDRCFITSTIKYPKLGGYKLRPATYSLFETLLGDKDFNSKAVFSKNRVEVNGNYYRFILVSEFPNQLEANSLREFGDYFLNLKKIPSMKSKLKLDMSRKQASAAFANVFQDFKGEAAFDQNNSLLQSLTYGDQELFKVECWFIIRGSTAEEADLFHDNLIERLLRRNYKIKPSSFVANTAWKNFLPGVNCDFVSNSVIQTSLAINLIPTTQDILMENGNSTFKSLRGNELNFKVFTKNALNYNSLYVGPSGSGKTFACGYNLFHEYVYGEAKLIILDKGGAYKKLTKYLDGHIFPGKFNPMMFKNNPTFLKEFILSMIPRNEISGFTISYLSKSLKTMDSSKLTTFDDVFNELPDDLRKYNIYFTDIQEYLSNEPIAEHEITYVDLQEYPKEVLPALLVFFLEYAEYIKGKKIIVMDEVHYALRHYPEFVEERARESRRKGISFQTLTQNFDEYTSTAIGRTVAQCTYYKFFFRQAISVGEFINEFDRAMISNVMTKKGEYSEFYLKCDEFLKRLQCHPNSFFYELLTTNREDCLEQEEIMNSFNSDLSFREKFNLMMDYKYAS